MSVLGITSAAISLAQKASRSAAVTRDAELEGQLADLVIHWPCSRPTAPCWSTRTSPSGPGRAGTRPR